MDIIKSYIEILGHDEELKTIFARGVYGSIALDIIPEALSYLKSCPDYKQLYMQVGNETEFIIPQGSSVDYAIQSWQGSRNKNRNMPNLQAQQPSSETGPSLM